MQKELDSSKYLKNEEESKKEGENKTRLNTKSNIEKGKILNNKVNHKTIKNKINETDTNLIVKPLNKYNSQRSLSTNLNNKILISKKNDLNKSKLEILIETIPSKKLEKQSIKRLRTSASNIDKKEKNIEKIIKKDRTILKADNNISRTIEDYRIEDKIIIDTEAKNLSSLDKSPEIFKINNFQALFLDKWNNITK